MCFYQNCFVLKARPINAPLVTTFEFHFKKILQSEKQKTKKKKKNFFTFRYTSQKNQIMKTKAVKSVHVRKRLLHAYSPMRQFILTSYLASRAFS